MIRILNKPFDDLVNLALVFGRLKLLGHAEGKDAVLEGNENTKKAMKMFAAVFGRQSPCMRTFTKNGWPCEQHTTSRKTPRLLNFS